MKYNIDQKIAIVTGGAQGLGCAFAEELLKKGAKVCICDLNVSQGNKVVKQWHQRFGPDSAIFIQCNVTDHNSFINVFQKTISRYGGIDIVVNNAGVSEEGEGWQKTIYVNLIGVIEGTRLAVEHMSKQNGGKGGLVVNISSTAGLTPVFYCPVYVGSKYGVVGYTRSMAYNPDIDDVGIRFTCLCPAFTDTGMFHTAFDQDGIVAKDVASKVAMNIGINTVESVAKGFLQLVETSNNNGGVMTVTKHRGIEYRHGKPLPNKL